MPDMAGPGPQPPAAAPMAAPTAQAGKREAALVKVRLAMKTLAAAVEGLGFDSKEGKAAIEILAKGAKAFGKTEDGADELVPQEAKQLAQVAGGAGAPPPGGPPMGPPGMGGPPGMPPMGPKVPGVGGLPGM